MEEQTIFDGIKSWLTTDPVGVTELRKNIIRFNKCRGVSTADNYRNYFTRAGYLKIVGRGRYLVMKPIPEDLTRRQLIKEAYPNSDWAQKLPRSVVKLQNAIWQNEMKRM